MSDLQLQVLQALDAKPIESTLVEFPQVELAAMQAALTSLAAREMVAYTTLESDVWRLTEEGQKIVEQGLHEFRLLEVVKQLGGLKLADVAGKLGKDGKLGQGRAFANKWIKKDGDVLVATVETLPEDTTALQLKAVVAGTALPPAKALAELKKRQLCVSSKQFLFAVTKGPEFALTVEQFETDVTLEMVALGSWKTAKFKPYNFNLEGVAPTSGSLHPLNKVREEFRQIFFLMGFLEMPSNQYVDSGFWNFDALYVPQQHPARDLQDTFYIKLPAVAGAPEDKQYWENVKTVHQDGAYGLIGYRYPWRGEELLRLVLRTHTTAILAQMLHRLAADPKPTRLFLIDRVFRNEAVDATHLAEFHQVEGVIADYNLTLGDLILFMELFFAKMGVHNLSFKPTYNPYTEPLLEIYSWHEGLGKLVEIGNSGMFRPEMLEAMGLPKDMRVLGWGLSLERPTMIKYECNNIRELLGHKVTLDFIETNPAARLDVDY